MADEWVCKINPTRFDSVTVADANALTKGTIMCLSADPNTAIAHAAGVNLIPMGILMEDKVASDGKTSMAVALDGVWEAKADGVGVTLGYPVIPSITGGNLIQQVPDTYISQQFLRCVMGTCMETASASETGVRVRLNL
jgi:hypothetical protein